MNLILHYSVVCRQLIWIENNLKMLVETPAQKKVQITPLFDGELLNRQQNQMPNTLINGFGNCRAQRWQQHNEKKK